MARHEKRAVKKTSEDNHVAGAVIAATGVAAVLATPLLGTFVPILGWSLGIACLGVAGKVREDLSSAGVHNVTPRKFRHRKRGQL